MMLRIQKERLTGVHIDLDEYTARYQLHRQRLRTSAPQAVVMHPGPMIRGLEITSDVADGPQSVIAEQVRHGVAIRMALIYRALISEPGKRVLRPRPAWRSARKAQRQERKRRLNAILIRGGHPGRSFRRGRCEPRPATQRRQRGCRRTPGQVNRCGQAGRRGDHRGRRPRGSSRSGRYPRPSARAGPGLQGNHCDRHCCGSGRWIHHRMRHAQHRSRQRFGGDHALDAECGAQSQCARLSHRRGYPRQHGRSPHRIRLAQGRRCGGGHR